MTLRSVGWPSRLRFRAKLARCRFHELVSRRSSMAAYLWAAS